MQQSLAKSFYYNTAAVWSWLTEYHPYGTNVFDQSWDMLIVLDGCRTDVFNNVVNKFGFISDISSIRSVGSITTEWMGRTFTHEYLEQIKNTAFICANPHTDTAFRQKNLLTNEMKTTIPFAKSKTVSPNQFDSFEEVWRYGYEEKKGVTPPRSVTDAAIRHARDGFNKMIVHYMQPHEPFISPESTIDHDYHSKNIWTAASNAERDESEVWNSYKSNLRYVLRETEILLKNVDAEKVVITSDHGNAMAEWGISGHPFGWIQPEVRRVPWAETTATDEKSHQPETRDDESHTKIKGQLRSLGYL